MHRLLSLVILFAFSVSASNAADLDHLQSAKAHGYHLINSEIVERPYHIYVQLPDGYEESDKTYPVIYLLDGGTTYPMLTAYFLLLGIDEPMPEAIIVGISYGGASFEEGNYRSTDYTAPSPEREYWGGAEKYQSFLGTELLPLIEKTYRADKSRRILFGQSLAGQFVLYSAMTNPDLFWGRIASNPALHRNLDYFLELDVAKPSGDPLVFIGAASGDAEQFQIPRDEWLKRWEREDLPWTFEVETLEGERHASAAPLVFRAGLRWLFPATEEIEN